MLLQRRILKVISQQFLEVKYSGASNQTMFVNF